MHAALQHWGRGLEAPFVPGMGTFRYYGGEAGTIWDEGGISVSVNTNQNIGRASASKDHESQIPFASLQICL